MVLVVIAMAAVMFLLAGLHGCWTGEVSIANRGGPAKLYPREANPFVFWWTCGFRFVFAAVLIKIAHELWLFDTPNTRK
jgi:hypothetical protein